MHSHRSLAVGLLAVSCLAFFVRAPKARADTPVFGITKVDTILLDPNASPYVPPETAVKPGDTVVLNVYFQTTDGATIASANFSPLGASVATSTGSWNYSASAFVAHLQTTVGSASTDGLATIPLTLTTSTGTTTSTTTRIRVDKTPPAIALFNLHFSTTTPRTGDTFFISGSVADAGSGATISDVTQTLLAANGTPPEGGKGATLSYYDFSALSAAIASSTDGSFTNVPFTIEDPNEDIPESATFTVTISAKDGAENVASSSASVALPAAVAPPFPQMNAPVLAEEHDAIRPYRFGTGVSDFSYPKFFVATGTLETFVEPLARFHGLTGTEEYSFALANASGLLDCTTPQKTADEWGITHASSISADAWNAPYVSIGPFSGTQCTVTQNAKLHIVPLRPDVPNESAFMIAMGSGNNHMNFRAYGPAASSMPPAPSTPKLDSVLFLPGIEGSRLYEGTGCGKSAEDKLWEPLASSVLRILLGAGDAKVKDLSLNADGTSACSDIYTKVGDIIDSAAGSQIYQPLIDQMNALVASTTVDMTAWEPVAYDWRLSLSDLLTKGREVDGKVYYEQATDTPYIEQTLRQLAATSVTGKVTIIAHSNGGLVAKALLLKLGDTEAAKLVDRLILVGAPQSGAPEDIGTTLVGYNAGIYRYGFPIVSDSAAQAFAQNSPMAYHLLPSEDYLASTATDAAHPVVEFSGSAYATDTAAYGARITNRTALDDFLLASAHDRDGSGALAVLNPTLIPYANAEHDQLDAWVPPASITVDQIAGWGNDTVAGIDFYTQERAPLSADAVAAAPAAMYRPIFTEDGDGTVPVPSALQMASSTNVKRFWVDLYSANHSHSASSKYAHANIFGITSLQTFIGSLLGATTTQSLPQYISASQPPTLVENKKLIFTLHSPLTLGVTDSSGNYTGLNTDGSIDQNIPGSTYGQFGETQYLIVPQGGAYTLSMAGQASGTFTLDMQESDSGTVTNTATISNVPTTADTRASLTIGDGLSTASTLSVDENGDGSNAFTVTPQVGETVSYVPPTPTPTPSTEPEANSAGASSGANSGGGGAISVSSVSAAPNPLPAQVASSSVPAAPATTAAPLIATTTQVATTTIATMTQYHAPARRVQKPVPLSQAATSTATTTGDQSQTASVANALSQTGKSSVGNALYHWVSGIFASISKFFTDVF